MDTKKDNVNAAATGSDSFDEEELMRSETGNMIFHGWCVWPSRVPRQPGYEYTEWIDYDGEWKTWSRPMCSLWLRLKWLFRRRGPNMEVRGARQNEGR